MLSFILKDRRPNWSHVSISLTVSLGTANESLCMSSLCNLMCTCGQVMTCVNHRVRVPGLVLPWASEMLSEVEALRCGLMSGPGSQCTA